MHNEKGAHGCARIDAIEGEAAFSIRQDWTDPRENAERSEGKERTATIEERKTPRYHAE